MQKQTSTQQLVLSAIMIAFIAVFAQIILPIGPIPFSMSVFGVMLAGTMLRPFWAAATIAVYLFLGLIGLPVFGGLQGGPQVLFGIKGGFIFGYILLALAASLAFCKPYGFVKRSLLLFLGLLGCYITGTLWFSFVTGTGLFEALLLCVVPFIFFDCIKIVLAVAIAQSLHKRISLGRAVS